MLTACRPGSVLSPLLLSSVELPLSLWLYCEAVLSLGLQGNLYCSSTSDVNLILIYVQQIAYRMPVDLCIIEIFGNELFEDC